MVGHEKIVNDVKNAYDETGRSVEAWRVAVENLTVTEARRNLQPQGRFGRGHRRFRRGQPSGRCELRHHLLRDQPVIGRTKAFNEAIRDLITRVGNGQVALEDLSEEVDKISEEFGDGSDASNRYAESLLDSAKRA